MGRCNGRKYDVNGRLLDTSREDVSRVYHDGTWSDSGIDVYLVPGGQVVQINWTNWQGRSDLTYLLGRIGEDDERIREVLLGHPHIERVFAALESLGLPGPDEIGEIVDPERVDDLITEFSELDRVAEDADLYAMRYIEIGRIGRLFLRSTMEKEEAVTWLFPGGTVSCVTAQGESPASALRGWDINAQDLQSLSAVVVERCIGAPPVCHMLKPAKGFRVADVFDGR